MDKIINNKNMKKKQRKQLKTFALAMQLMEKDHRQQRVDLLAKIARYIEVEKFKQKELNEVMEKINEEIEQEQNI